MSTVLEQLEETEQEVIDLVKTHGVCTRTQLMEGCTLVANETDLAALIHNLIKAKIIQRTPGGEYTLAQHPVREQADVQPADEMKERLMLAVDDAQDALDCYVFSVADHDILKALMTARDQARRALALYSGDTLDE